MRKITTSVAVALILAPALSMAHSDRRVADGTSDNPGSTYCTFPDGTHSLRGEIHCMDPASFMKAYGIDKLHAAGITGKGQTIILLDAFGSPTMQADLDAFSDTFHLPRKKIKFIYPNGLYVNTLLKPDTKDPSKQVADGDKIGWAGETTLDLEWAHAVAPDAELVNVVTNVSETEGVQGLPELFKGIEMAAEKYPNGIISMSFGTGEQTFTGLEVEDELKGRLHKSLFIATKAGMTLLAATGDDGSAGLNLDMSSMMDIQSTNYPASDPLVTAVGGTALQYGWKWNPQGTLEDYLDCKSRQAQQKTANPQATPAACPNDFFASEAAPDSRIETIWKEDWTMAGGGGGISTVFGMPDYQRQALPQAIRDQSRGFRTIPDVSMHAAVNGGVMTYSSYAIPGKDKNPSWTSVGGTSAATPEMAALVALAGQRASDLMGKQVGIGALNPLLYTINSADFNDMVPQTFGASNQVLIDNNSLYFSDLGLQIFGPTSETPISVAGYSVLPGYDIATGLGTPIADRFVEDLARARVMQDQNQTQSQIP